MTLFEHTLDRGRPLTWRWGTLDGRRMPSITCRCGRAGPLEDHEVSLSGHVTPSVHHDEPSCGFHDHVRLEGYRL